MVGTPPDAFAPGASAHPTNRARHSYPTLPPRGKSAEIFLLIRDHHRIASPSRIRREKAGSCRMKKACRSFAFGSSQRNRMALMFGAARFWRRGLSASRAKEFRITPRGMRGAPRRRMRHKCFRQRWILECAGPRAGVTRIKRLKRREFSLSLARRKPQLAFSPPQRA
jgi:hypothetical protein